MGKAVREQSATVQVLQIFLKASKCPGTIRPEPENLPSNLPGFVCQSMRLREKIGVQQADEVCEAVVISVVRCCREKHDVVGLGSQFLGELIPLGLFYLVPTR
jgi:hypothetical protein